MEKTNETDWFEAAFVDKGAAIYAKEAVEVATIMGRVESMIDDCDILREMKDHDDDGAPYFDLKAAHDALGRALASLVSYAYYYVNHGKKK